MFHLLIRSGDLDSALRALAYFKPPVVLKSNPRLPLTHDFTQIKVIVIAAREHQRLHVRLQLTGQQEGEHRKDLYRYVCASLKSSREYIETESVVSLTRLVVPVHSTLPGLRRLKSRKSENGWSARENWGRQRNSVLLLSSSFGTDSSRNRPLSSSNNPLRV
jgi:hypothetical protein